MTFNQKIDLRFEDVTFLSLTRKKRKSDLSELKFKVTKVKVSLRSVYSYKIDRNP